jgi:hypothetical protein
MVQRQSRTDCRHCGNPRAVARAPDEGEQHADGAERLAHRVEAMRLDDCNDVFHALALRLRSSTRILR